MSEMSTAQRIEIAARMKSAIDNGNADALRQIILSDEYSDFVWAEGSEAAGTDALKKSGINRETYVLIFAKCQMLAHSLILERVRRKALEKRVEALEARDNPRQDTRVVFLDRAKADK